MSTQRESGVGTILPMTVRGHDETFARHLQCRLKSLGGETNADNSQTNSNTDGWNKTVKGSNITNNNGNTDNDEDDEIFYEYSINSPGSPVEELVENEIQNSFLTNKDNLPQSYESCHCVSLDSSTSYLLNSLNGAGANDDTETSDSSEYYDPENSDTELLNSLSIRAETLKLSEDTTDGVSLKVPPLETETVTVKGNEKQTNGENFCSSLNITKHMTIDCSNTLDLLNCNFQEESSTEQKLESLEKSPKNDDNDNDDELRVPRVRRCSSLKTGKTPPGTPGQKKIVRFADVLGLDLADVRTYLDEIPKIPTSAYEDLNAADINISNNETDLIAQQTPIFTRQKPEKILVPLFQQPGGEPDFLDRVRERQCCLENACVQDNVELSISGTVRVRNIDFHKSVHIRYTLDSWKTYSDLQATYVPNSCDGFSDKFSFLLYCHTLDIGQRIEFAIKFTTSGLQFWDNNNGANYCFQCLPAITNSPFSPIIPAPDEHWGNTSFY